MKVLGIDAGSFKTVSWTAILDGDRFTLGTIRLRPGQLGIPEFDAGQVVAVAVDAPQGLPQPGGSRRACDAAARTPTNRLPLTRHELERGTYDDGKIVAFAPVIRLGVDLFWAHRHRVYDGGVVEGRLIETYPRAVLRHLGVARIPSKVKEPVEYGALVARLLADRGLRYPEVAVPSPDQADAMLCALAARAAAEGWCERLGLPPVVDENEGVLREGYIVVAKPGSP
jgi:predicted nuclease with RNAse H fold